jgi:hypothetical protein
MDTLRVPKLVTHPDFNPGGETVDPYPKVSPGPGGQNSALRCLILKAAGPKPRGKS